MKAQPIIQFSGYPLRVVEPGPKIESHELTIIRPAIVQTSLQKNEITNDPKNWDERWFSNYE